MIAATTWCVLFWKLRVMASAGCQALPCRALYQYKIMAVMINTPQLRRRTNSMSRLLTYCSKQQGWACTRLKIHNFCPTPKKPLLQCEIPILDFLTRLDMPKRKPKPLLSSSFFKNRGVSLSAEASLCKIKTKNKKRAIGSQAKDASWGQLIYICFMQFLTADLNSYAYYLFLKMKTPLE